MKYQLLPLDPDLDPVDFDTQSILDLARLGPYDKDAGVVYFDGVACLEPRPDKTTTGHVRRLEAELLAMKAGRDRLMRLLESLTPGGSEYHENPEMCVEFVKGRYATGTSLVVKRNEVEAERDLLLAACEAMLNGLSPDTHHNTDPAAIKLLCDAIAAAKGDS